MSVAENNDKVHCNTFSSAIGTLFSLIEVVGMIGRWKENQKPARHDSDHVAVNQA